MEIFWDKRVVFFLLGIFNELRCHQAVLNIERLNLAGKSPHFLIFSIKFLFLYIVLVRIFEFLCDLVSCSPVFRVGVATKSRRTSYESVYLEIRLLFNVFA